LSYECDGRDFTGAFSLRQTPVWSGP